MLSAALQVASLGYPVFPCKQLSKKPLTTNGFHNASTDPEVIRKWWSRWPNANVAIATAGLVVIDVDDLGSRWFGERKAQLEGAAGAIAFTPRGGIHYIFRRPADAKFKCSASVIDPGIDVRTDGGYIVIAPSITKDGSYGWCDRRALSVPAAELPDLPDWLAADLARTVGKPSSATKKSQTRSLNPELNEIGRFGEGERNSRLTSIAGSLRRGGLDALAMESLLMQINQERCDPPLSDAEVSKIAESVERYPPKPASPPSLRLAQTDVPPPAPESGTAKPGAEPEAAPKQDGRSPILLGPDEHRVTDQVIGVLARDKQLFQRMGRLVRVVVGAKPKRVIKRSYTSPTIIELLPPSIRDRICRSCCLFRPSPQGELKEAHPPQWLPAAVSARAFYPGYRELVGISSIPIMRSDGSVWQAPGYDEATGVQYIPGAKFPRIPENPTAEQAGHAAFELCDVVHDFPLEHESDRAAWLAALLSIVGRDAYDGPTPLFLCDANIRGAGKGLLMNTIGHIVHGHDLAVSSYSSDEEEMRKKITAIALAGDRVVSLDNLEGKFGNAALDRMLTSTVWSDRILGKSERVSIPIATVWLATGNNVLVAADTARRVVQIRLDILEEKPEDRTGFKHPKLLEWIGTQRPRLLVAAYTIVVAYIRAGRPNQNLRPMGSYEAWSDLIRSAVVWVGMTDPCEGRDRLVAYSDSSAEAHCQLVEAWKDYDPQGKGIVLAEIVADLYPPDAAVRPLDTTSIAMRSALEGLTGSPAGRTLDVRRLAAKVKHHRRKVVGGCFLDSNPEEKHRGGAVWRLYRRVGNGSEPWVAQLPV